MSLYFDPSMYVVQVEMNIYIYIYEYIHDVMISTINDKGISIVKMRYVLY